LIGITGSLPTGYIRNDHGDEMLKVFRL